MQKNIVTVVVPIYKTNLSETEKMSFKQCLKVLGNYNIVFAQPENLDTSSLTKSNNIKVEYFPEKYFKSVFGYNSLLLSKEFYQRFLSSKYILIYQLDAFVFRDDLQFWCNKNYDYIGAPWIASPNTFVKKALSIFDSKKKKERSKIFFKVGNGGLSLRNTEKCFKISSELSEEIALNLQRDNDDFYIMEDVFWSITVPTYYPDFKIPDYKEALNFAMDRKPHLALKLNNNLLPFGCHGFEKPKVKEFWEEILKEHSLL
jgi:hypothetical protein